MVTWRAYACVLCCLPAVAFSIPTLAAKQSSDNRSEKSTTTGNGLSIAVADFSGTDKELGRVLADTLLTDLAQSEQLRMVERSEIGKVLTELKLQSTGLAEPQDVKKVGKLLGADRLIVGSFHIQDNQLLINARLLDLKTGRVTQGGAANVSGRRDDVLALIHQLAHRFHRRVTGNDFGLEIDVTPGPATPEPSPKEESREERRDMPDEKRPTGGFTSGSISGSAGGYSVTQPEETETVLKTISRETHDGEAGASLPPIFKLPSSFVSNHTVLNGDITRMLTQSGVPNPTSYFSAGSSTMPVTRLRVLTVLLKASGLVAPASAPAHTLVGQIPDGSFVSSWAVGYVQVALDQKIWPTGRVLKPRDDASWEFLAFLTERMNQRNRLVRARLGRTNGLVTVADRASNEPRTVVTLLSSRGEVSPDPPVRQSSYTGLLIEAYGLPVQRAMGPRIVDTNGRVLYPEGKIVPDIDYLQDHGMADYYYDRVDAPRAGSRPLIVRAIALNGDDLIVDDMTASRIVEMSRRDGFLRQWRVGIILDRNSPDRISSDKHSPDRSRDGE